MFPSETIGIDDIHHIKKKERKKVQWTVGCDEIKMQLLLMANFCWPLMKEKDKRAPLFTKLCICDVPAGATRTRKKQEQTTRMCPCRNFSSFSFETIREAQQGATERPVERH
ncbi:hypothetical protein OUZ56_022408 [Daphnia magna]|uniref:Uncharacterized protein n=1 Tax=Daphnia magna TaxID=35525 RepID=A0ABR0AWA6_9CRUS|nr:hypothetical protein OUZ56_022408 [Daphnia magna]